MTDFTHRPTPPSAKPVITPPPIQPPPLVVSKKPKAFTPAVPPLPWYSSKTTWLGVLTVIVSLLPFMGNVIPDDQREAFASAMATVAPIVGSVIGGLVIWFRRSADAPIKGGPADPTKKEA